jgi:phospholipase A-2-activating protein
MHYSLMGKMRLSFFKDSDLLDRTVRVWRDGACVQTIPHPTMSVWAVCVLGNGDIVSGAR